MAGCGATASLDRGLLIHIHIHIHTHTTPRQVYVGWAGTDASGRSLKSYSRDIYRFTNAFTG